MRFLFRIISFIKMVVSSCLCHFSYHIFFARNMADVPEKSIVFCPLDENLLCCGLAGIVAVKGRAGDKRPFDIKALGKMVTTIEDNRFKDCFENNQFDAVRYLGGRDFIDGFLAEARHLKEDDLFAGIYINSQVQRELGTYTKGLQAVIDNDSELLAAHMGRLETKAVDMISDRLEGLRDIVWCLNIEILENITKVKALLGTEPETPQRVKIFRKVNAVLNSIDRLEVRGRDSAGISLMFSLASSDFDRFKATLDQSADSGLAEEFKDRTDRELLINRDISLACCERENGGGKVTLTFTYKIAAEIGSLGDNIAFLREQMTDDQILHLLTGFPYIHYTVTSHTRWASVGAITVENCHPVDNRGREAGKAPKNGIIHACLNGDIDNYQDLKKQCEQEGLYIHEAITTDTKIIPLWIERYLRKGLDFLEAFRLAVNDFKGSHAISVHTDSDPGKIFLAQKGSGQAIFVGLGTDHYMPTSEVYGFIEETPYFLKMAGEKEVEGGTGKTQGQIFILDQESEGQLQGIRALYYDGTPVLLNPEDIKYTEITSRDIDRQGFPHYFLKEITESPASVEKTLLNRWKINDQGKYEIVLDDKVFPPSLRQALVGKGKSNGRIKRIFFVGQGTAGVAALACAEILNFYLNDPGLHASALKASELSGFKLGEHDDSTHMKDALVVAITQSGTTTDTNRTVDMVKEKGAHTLAIVNRRDSDITFKVDGVMYTSSGRDIEMSVASTKAFYSQIVAGAIISLYIAGLKGRRSEDFISSEVLELLAIPGHMRKILALQDSIKTSAERISATKKYWAAVGSGPNKASADEIRIKLSELCYKTISTDYIEDKKHIDLSSEPLIIVCAAGTRGKVIGDIIKDTAIFKAHKAAPIVIADEGEDRFDAYAEDVFHVPIVSEHLAPILNTLVGHLWGYYAALAINEGSKLLHTFREDLRKTIDLQSQRGMDTYEIMLGRTFREKIAAFYHTFRQKRFEKKSPLAISMASDLALLLKYLSGKLPPMDFELDFGTKGLPLNMLNTLFEFLGESINQMSRPVDAIKHQAKTVTVGTSRISERLEGILFDALRNHNINISQISSKNIVVLKNLQDIISEILGAIFYKIEGLNSLGEPTEETTIQIIKKEGVLASIPSRVEKDNRLKGTKRIIVGSGNVYIGKGRKDGRNIIVIPAITNFPDSPNIIEYILLLNIGFKADIPLAAKKKALGVKYELIKGIVQENYDVWEDRFLEMVDTTDLFGRSSEMITEMIMARYNETSQN